MWRGWSFLRFVGIVSFVFLWLGIRIFASRACISATLQFSLNHCGNVRIAFGALGNEFFQEIFFICHEFLFLPKPCTHSNNEVIIAFNTYRQSITHPHPTRIRLIVLGFASRPISSGQGQFDAAGSFVSSWRSLPMPEALGRSVLQVRTEYDSSVTAHPRGLHRDRHEDAEPQLAPRVRLLS